MQDGPDTYLEGIIVNHRCNAAVILENHRWFEEISRKLLRLEPQRINYWSFDHDLFLISNVLVSVAQGASVVAALAERFRISGAKKIVRIATTGSLQSELVVGDIVIPYSCIRDEGTSPHYLPPGVPAVASVDFADFCAARLEHRSFRVKRGMVWPTDGRWKETDQKIAEFKRLGCLAVDMETAALFAFGMDRNIPVISFNIVKDSPHEDCGKSFDFRGVAVRQVWFETIMPLFLRLFETVLCDILTP